MAKDNAEDVEEAGESELLEMTRRGLLLQLINMDHTVSEIETLVQCYDTLAARR